MDNEVYQKIVNDYESSKKIKEAYRVLLEKKEELEKNELIRDYLLLTQLIKDYNKSQVEKSDKEIMYDVFKKNLSKSKNTNELYVYVGTYCYAKGINIKGTIDKRVDRDSEEADYHLYINLEKEVDTKQIPISETVEFERTHKIIYANNRQEYRLLQQEFAEGLIQYGQEETIKKMTKNN